MKYSEDSARPYTHEELDELKSILEASITHIERENPNVRPLPPLTEEEARELLLALTQTASEHTLTNDECFLAGQLTAAYCMSIEARMLGKHGRFYVIAEADLDKMLKDGLTA